MFGASISLNGKATVFQHDHSGYVGKPSPELDEQWNKLLQNFNVRITEQELRHTAMKKEDAIELPDSGYYAGLTAYHGLHRIKRLHHYMYPEYYFPNFI
ncbi:hypothetical protein LEL_07210 [Akanthomyces lecanii RCEF 1005]|uniref:Uncharacterized protein n=1 Tax=Akanthomyces lecanii RCEF 1005 TaxID=1081108 RepID=A0A162JY67_CORDF|nr:hypothetical protein LEL_07210 [Akanthomyces lecanii RCEF 1005]